MKRPNAETLIRDDSKTVNEIDNLVKQTSGAESKREFFMSQQTFVLF